MKPVFWNLIRTPPEKRNMTEVEDNRQKLAAYLGMADAHLAKNEYLTAAGFTMADIPLAVLAHRWFNVPIERPQLPHFERWFWLVSGRPGFKLHCAAPLT
jgi:glutathione S-transferase